MASRGPDRLPGPPLWLPACKMIVLRLARSARHGGLSASNTSTSGTRLHRLHRSVGAGQSPGQRLCRPPEVFRAPYRSRWRGASAGTCASPSTTEVILTIPYGLFDLEGERR